ERLISVGLGVTLTVVLMVTAIGFSEAAQSSLIMKVAEAAAVALLAGLFALLLRMRTRAVDRVADDLADADAGEQPQPPFLDAGALQDAIYNSAGFCSIATDTD